MKAPGFWQDGCWQASILSPLEHITRTLTARRVAKPGFDCGVPVLCAGNATVGGAGKTILARDLLARLPAGAFALTRGYGGRLAGPVRIDATAHTARDAGDEPLLLAATAPTILAADRAAGAKLAVCQGASAIVMDDGLQNPGLRKTASFLVIDGGQGFGNGHLLPAGPLREPAAAAAARCAAAVLIGPDQHGVLSQLPPSLPVFGADLIPACNSLSAGMPVIAFAGIGRPGKFFASAAQLGFDMRRTIAFPDHHHYDAGDEQMLSTAAAAQAAMLVTTEKDYVKLSPGLRALCHVITVTLGWRDEAGFERLLRQIIGRRPNNPALPDDGPPRS